jgi:hypothetical protein
MASPTEATTPVGNCFYCAHKHRQLRDALASGNTDLIRDINHSLSEHLRRSHVPEGAEQ